MQINKKWIALVSAATLLAAAVACGGGGGDPSPGGSTATATTPASASTDTSEPGREIEVLMQDNFFEPTEIRLAVGEAVTINAKNVGVAIHNMHVLSSETEGKDYTSTPLVNPGESSEFLVQFSTPGTYKFQCDFHLPGMVGEITVE